MSLRRARARLALAAFATLFAAAVTVPARAQQGPAPTLGVNPQRVGAVAPEHGIHHAGMAPALEDRSNVADEIEWVEERREWFRGPDLELFGTQGVDRALRGVLGTGFGSAAHVELMLTHWLGVHAGLTWLELPGRGDLEGAFYWGTRLGLRLHWTGLAGLRGHDGWIDLHDAFGRSGVATRHGLDVGTGYDFRVADLLAVGPFARLLWASDPQGFDPLILTFGVSVQVDPPTRRFKPRPRIDPETETHIAEHVADSPFLRRLGDAPPLDDLRDHEPIVADAEAHLVRSVDAFGARELGWGGGAALHVEVLISRLVGLHLGGVVHAMPPAQAGAFGTSVYLGSRAGVRVHWTQALGWDALDGWVDVHHAFATSGGVARHGFDAGTGLGVHLTPEVSVGPFVRLTYGSDPNGDDPLLLTVGATIALLAGVRHGRSVADGDRDGVADAHDLCPGEHATTSRPSDTRRGCPTADTDHDGWHDDVDACTTDPAGANPDAAHPGCPLPDRDADGIADAEDVCPTEPGGFEDALRHDCP